jgi:hypothetical protein
VSCSTFVHFVGDVNGRDNRLHAAVFAPKEGWARRASGGESTIL